MSLRGIRRTVTGTTREFVFRQMVKHLDTKRWTALTKRLADDFDRKRLKDFIAGCDFAQLDVSGYADICIGAGEYDYEIVNMCFCQNVLMNVAHCLSKRQLPVVRVRNKGGQNLWEQFFEQPYPQVRPDRDSVDMCDVLHPALHTPWFPAQEDVQLFSKLYRPPIFVLNQRTREYVEAEYEEIFGKRGYPRVCGVLFRGTDYKEAKYHPKQPPVSDVIEHVREKMEELHCEYIYLATEEYRTQKMFDEAFPGKVLINKRHYYDAYWDLRRELGQNVRISMLHDDAEDEEYRKSLEYLSSLILLSRCQALIAGTCGGSNAALYMNGGKYEYCHLYNLGRNK